MHHVVIGGNAAGMSAAAKIRRTAPADTLTVLEKSSIVSFGGCGLPYYVGDFFSDKRYLLHRSPERFREDGVDLRLNHTVTRVDPVKREVIGLDGHGEQFSLTYDNLIVTSGADSITPPIEGVGLKNIYTLRVLNDGEAIKEAISSTGEHAVVVGGGFIGLEIAEALHRAGKKVRIIELMDRVLKTAVSPEISNLAHQEILSHGVELSLEEKVEAFRGEGSVQSVVTSKGTYPADLVILSVGVKVQTQFLASSGIDMLPNGAIIVNNKGESSIDHIYAAGDCAAVPAMYGDSHVFSPLATSANKLGRIIGDRIGGKRQGLSGFAGHRLRQGLRSGDRPHRCERGRGFDKLGVHQGQESDRILSRAGRYLYQTLLFHGNRKDHRRPDGRKEWRCTEDQPYRHGNPARGYSRGPFSG